MARKQTRNKSGKRTRTPFFPVDGKEEFAQTIGRHVYDDIVEIIRLKSNGAPTKLIMSSLGISRATYFRRVKMMKQMADATPERAYKAAVDEIEDTIEFYKSMRIEALKMSGLFEQHSMEGRSHTVDPATKSRGMKLALKAQAALIDFLHSVGFWEPYKAAQTAKSNATLREYADDVLIENVLQLLDENQILRENIDALRRGEPEPHCDNEREVWRIEIPGTDKKSSETCETHSAFSCASIFH